MFYDFIYLAKGFRMRLKVRSTLMASEGPIRRKPYSHANNFESLITFRNTYTLGGGGDGGRWGGCNMLVIFFSLVFLLVYPISLSLSLSLSLTTTKKNACTLTSKFLCIFLRNARAPAPSPHTNGKPFKSLNINLSSRGRGRGAGARVLGP